MNLYRFECVLHMQADSESDAWQGANEALLWQAQAALSAALYNLGEPDEGLASAEHALQLLNTYLMETELCKQ